MAGLDMCAAPPRRRRRRFLHAAAADEIEVHRLRGWILFALTLRLTPMDLMTAGSEASFPTTTMRLPRCSSKGRHTCSVCCTVSSAPPHWWVTHWCCLPPSDFAQDGPYSRYGPVASALHGRFPLARLGYPPVDIGPHLSVQLLRWGARQCSTPSLPCGCRWVLATSSLSPYPVYDLGHAGGAQQGRITEGGTARAVTKVLWAYQVTSTPASWRQFHAAPSPNQRSTGVVLRLIPGDAARHLPIYPLSLRGVADCPQRDMKPVPCTSTPARCGVPASLNYIPLNGTQQQPLTPYPSWHDAFVSSKACCAATNNTVVSAFRVTVDKSDRLWVVDNGVADMASQVRQIADPAIFVFDLTNDKLIHKYVFRDDELKDCSVLTSIRSENTEAGKAFHSLNIRPDNEGRAKTLCVKFKDADNIKVVDESGGRNNTFAYITDMGASALVVYSLAENCAWRVEHPLFKFDPDAGVYRVGGVDFYWSDGVSSATLAPPLRDG
ncbi:hypothetical protein MSG28_011112 [Choristoneura fumiferana]|uniref:Uncharacterized protein n=1 Tax=Choristoneura fumiferana TaxID=7141 RepID=A0ACC0KRC3_CHOFU|nr:hypothetical protein MSG28_011112 [Choristoneura fumiferana]